MAKKQATPTAEAREIKPSEVSGIRWIRAERQAGEYPGTAYSDRIYSEACPSDDYQRVVCPETHRVLPGVWEYIDWPSAALSGKWLVFVDIREVDAAWESIKGATEAGKLGSSAKVSTPGYYPGGNPDEHVICVYTYDWTDREDVTRVREELRKLGITKKIAYKWDGDTLNDVYRANGYTNISKYYE